MAEFKAQLPPAKELTRTIAPPDWASREHTDLQWFYQNEYGEAWVARLFGTELYITGLDIGWAEIRLNVVEAGRYLQRFTRQLFLEDSAFVERLLTDDVARSQAAAAKELEPVAESGIFTIKNWVLDRGEATWLASVLTTAIPVMQNRINKENRSDSAKET